MSHITVVHTGVCNPVEHIRTLIREYHYPNEEMTQKHPFLILLLFDN